MTEAHEHLLALIRAAVQDPAAVPEARAAYDAWRREAAAELEAQAAELLRRAGEMRG